VVIKMSFKAGDKVKITKDNCNHRYPVGKILTVSRFSSGDTIYVKEGKTVFSDEECKKVGKGAKEKPIKFIAVYDENDIDPVELFFSKTALNKWLKEARDNVAINWGTIRIFPVRGELEVHTEISLKKKPQ